MNEREYQELIEAMMLYMDKNLLSLESFSKQLGVSYNSVHMWIHGKRKPNRQSLLKLIRFFEKKEKELDDSS